MNKIKQAFDKKALIAFITGGDPDIQTTKELILGMANSGADIIEIGIPFSDPVAEGPIIQEADARALSGGCTTDSLFPMVKEVRKETDIPLLFMTYLNPIFTYGKDRFIQQCANCGIDGIIVPDMPFEEKGELSGLCKQYGVTLVSLIAPTSNERVTMIAQEAEGFLYCISSLGVTGVRSEINTSIGTLIKQVRTVSSIPCAIGFGISTPKQAAEMANLSDGVIVGSAIVKLVGTHGKECVPHVMRFIKDLKEAITQGGEPS